MIAAVSSDLGPEEINDALLETYHHWVSFALGQGSIGGRLLKFPSGRYASSIVAKREMVTETLQIPNPVFAGEFISITQRKSRIVAIYVDEASEGSKEAKIIEHGHPAFSLKSRMLAGGKSFRRIKIGSSSASPAAALMNYRGNNPLTTRGNLRVNKPTSKMWAENYAASRSSNSKWRTMSSKPGSAQWIIPAMRAYSPARILREQLDPSLRDRVIVP